MSMTAKRRLHDVYQLTDFETAVRRYLPKAVFEYIRNGAGNEFSLRRNRTIFERFLWRPYRLRDVSPIRTKVTLFGEEYDQPLGLRQGWRSHGPFRCRPPRSGCCPPS